MAKTVVTINDAEYVQLHAQGTEIAFIREEGEDVWYRKITDDDTETWHLIPKKTELSSGGTPLVVDGIIFQAPYNPENVPEESD